MHLILNVNNYLHHNKALTLNRLMENFIAFSMKYKESLLDHTEKSVFSKMIRAKNIFYGWHFFLEGDIFTILSDSISNNNGLISPYKYSLLRESQYHFIKFVFTKIGNFPLPQFYFFWFFFQPLILWLRISLQSFILFPPPSY